VKLQGEERVERRILANGIDTLGAHSRVRRFHTRIPPFAAASPSGSQEPLMDRKVTSDGACEPVVGIFYAKDTWSYVSNRPSTETGSLENLVASVMHRF